MFKNEKIHIFILLDLKLGVKSLSSNNNRTKKKSGKNAKKFNIKWIILITIWTFVLAVFVSIISENLMRNMILIYAFIILIIIILIGILFDTIGIAVAAASEKPFHSMAANKVLEGKYAVKLVRNAVPVSNFCNDVIGDICGIVSGAAGSIIILKLVKTYSLGDATLYSIAMSSLIASLTVGGKAFGKEVALKNSNKIIYFVAKIIMILDKKIGVCLLPDIKKK